MLLVVVGTVVSFESCKKGCTDPSATNYNADAKKDDGSCEFVTADVTKPTITVTSPTEGAVINKGDMLTISGKANDNSALKSFSVKFELGPVLLKDSITTVTGTEHSFSQTVSTAIMPAGEYTLTFTSTDAANNVSDPVVVKITIKDSAPSDTEKPMVNAISVKIPTNGKLNSGFENTITIDVSDNEALDFIDVEIYNLNSGSPVLVGSAKVANSSITDPKSYKGDVKVTIQNLGGSVLNWPAEILVKAQDKAGNTGEKKQPAVLEN